MTAKLTPRSIAAAALLALLCIGAIRPVFLGILTTDRSILTRIYSIDADRGTPEYPRFMEQVAKRTAPGDSIAIFVPMRRWDDGYAYAYYRASFILAGRRVLPLVWSDDRLLRQHMRDADYVAAWQMNVGGADLRPVWSGAGGTLLKREGR